MDAIKAKVIFEQLARELRSMAESGEQLSLALDTGPHLERGQQILYSSCRRPFVPLFRRLRKRASSAMAEWRPDRYALDRSCYLGRDPFTDKIFGLGKPHVYAWTESSRHVTEVPDLLTAAADLMESFATEADRALRVRVPPHEIASRLQTPSSGAIQHDSRVTEVMLSDAEREVVEVLRSASGPLNAKEISRAIGGGVTGEAIRQRIQPLKRAGLVLSRPGVGYALPTGQ